MRLLLNIPRTVMFEFNIEVHVWCLNYIKNICDGCKKLILNIRLRFTLKKEEYKKKNTKQQKLIFCNFKLLNITFHNFAIMRS